MSKEKRVQKLYRFFLVMLFFIHMSIQSMEVSSEYRGSMKITFDSAYTDYSKNKKDFITQLPGEVVVSKIMPFFSTTDFGRAGQVSHAWKNFFSEFLCQKKAIFEHENNVLREWVKETRNRYGHAFVSDDQLIAKKYFNKDDYNQLLMRAMKYKPELVSIILKRKVDPNTIDIYGHTCLRVASNCIKIDSTILTNCEKLIALGADINMACACCSSTPLLQAVINSNYDLVELLVKNGAQDRVNRHGRTALLVAQKNAPYFWFDIEKKALFDSMVALLTVSSDSFLT